MRPKAVASAYVAAAATAPSSSRFRTGSRRTRARARTPVASDATSGGATASAVARGVSGVGSALVAATSESIRASAAERERAGRQHPVGNAPRLHRVPEDGKRTGEWGAVRAERGGERAGDLVDRKALAGRDVNDVGGEDVRDRRPRRAGANADHGNERARRGAQHLFVGRRGGLSHHADDGRGLGRIAVRAHERRVASGPELRGELFGEDTGDEDRAPRRQRAAAVPSQRDDVARPDPERVHRRPPSRPRAWIACRMPMATRFATIDEPPTVTNGSGIPVTGAMPMVMPTLTNTWKRKPKTRPPATTAPYMSPATVTTRRPRQTTSR